jgi:hypothetical protein
MKGTEREAIHLHIVPSLKMRGTLSRLHFYAFMEWCLDVRKDVPYILITLEEGTGVNCTSFTVLVQGLFPFRITGARRSGTPSIPGAVPAQGNRKVRTADHDLA